MANTKPDIQAEAPKFPRKAAQLQCRPGATDKEIARDMAALVASPDLAAARIINHAEGKSGVGDDIDVPYLMAHLRDQAAAVNGGNLMHAEAMLMNQATALQSLFARLAERGMGCDGVIPFEANMRMALRAQSQCRATLETLAAIKNPPIVFARQANIAHGPQQVNNGIQAPGSRTGNSENQQNELSGGGDELLPDGRASQATSRVDPPMEAVGEVNRAEIGGR